MQRQIQNPEIAILCAFIQSLMQQIASIFGSLFGRHGVLSLASTSPTPTTMRLEGVRSEDIASSEEGLKHRHGVILHATTGAGLKRSRTVQQREADRSPIALLGLLRLLACLLAFCSGEAGNCCLEHSEAPPLGPGTPAAFGRGFQTAERWSWSAK